MTGDNLFKEQEWDGVIVSSSPPAHFTKSPTIVYFGKHHNSEGKHVSKVAAFSVRNSPNLWAQLLRWMNDEFQFNGSLVRICVPPLISALSQPHSPLSQLEDPTIAFLLTASDLKITPRSLIAQHIHPQFKSTIHKFSFKFSLWLWLHRLIFISRFQFLRIMASSNEEKLSLAPELVHDETLDN